MSAETALDPTVVHHASAKHDLCGTWGWCAPVLLAALLRLLLLAAVVHACGIAGVWTFDTSGYVDPIRNLLHGSFSTQNSLVTRDGPDILRTPGYPIFLMLTGMAGNHPVQSVVWQIGVACLSVFLVYRIALLVFQSESLASCCAFLYAVEPLSIIYSVELFAETLFTALLLGFLYALVKYLRSPRWSLLILAAVLVSASTYVKPVSYYLGPCCAVGLAILPWQLGWAAKLRRAAAFLAVCAILIGAWQIRNYKETGYSGFSSIAETQLYYCNALGVVARRTHQDYFRLQNELGLGNPNGYLYQHPELARKEAIRILKGDPWLYLRLHSQGMLVVLVDPCATDLLRHLGLYPSAGGLMSMVVNRGIPSTLLWLARHRPLPFAVTMLLGSSLLAYYTLMMLGLSRVVKRPEVFAVFTLICAYFVAVSGGPVASGRYRYPIMPIIVIFAGAGLERLLEKMGRRGQTPDAVVAD